MRSFLKGMVLILSTLVLSTACQKKSKHSGGVNLADAPADAPIASGDAKPVLSIKLPDLVRANKETLVKAQTTAATTWDWTQLTGPGTVLFQTPQAAETLMRADKDGVYTIRLTIRNEEGQTVSNDLTLQWDTRPPAVVVSEEIRTFQTTLVEGKVGSDADRVEWIQVNGPGTLVFTAKDNKSTKITASQDGTYTVRFKAWDDLGNEASADMRFIWDTVAPAVTVGQDRYTNQEIILDAVTVDAVTYSWTKVSGPGVVVFSSASAEDTTAKATMDGTYVLRLTTTKATGATASDELTFVWDTQAPVVSLGLDRSSRYRATIDATTEDGMIFRWSVKSGPGTASFSLPNSEDTSITTNLAGDYDFELMVTDLAGNTASDTLRITFENDLRVLAKQLSSGGSSTCAVLDDDALSCWGYNFEGELGYGDNKDRYMPPSFGLNLGYGKNAMTVSSGFSHICAILQDRTVKCWGQNVSGQLGYGDQLFRGLASQTSINLGLGRTAKAIATGFAHSCAILDDGSVKCWGANGSGQLGYGDRTNRLAPPLTPIDLGQGRTARALALGAYHSCAVLDDFTVKCWGSNSDGQLGYNDKIQRTAPAATAVDFGANVTVRSMNAGTYHSCAVLSDSSLRCWGRNSEGQLGYGDTTVRLAPAATGIDIGTGLVPRQVTAGLSHTCALFDGGTFQCWGANDEGQLASGDTIGRTAPTQTAVTIAPGRAVMELSAGRQHTCALLDDRTLKCWGSNTYGQIGNGGTANQLTVPEKVIEYGSKTSTLVTRR
ncbi:MAG TPA: Ig-like domain repeat protein [Oligoflexus sp.]|uniref:RCC1 domain-containing protein n=1 Tax=Oligoflexus sp. TaxID=1971216 RepID=UPI002D698C49|nr:Ig-like domain repeat protein [Oligoflexus sp.]HYX32428.1 Ig-like domain repeat protein [Oligoflexus sp.]